MYSSQILKKTKPRFNFVHVPEDEDDDGDGVLDVDEDDDNEELWELPKRFVYLNMLWKLLFKYTILDHIVSS